MAKDKSKPIDENNKWFNQLINPPLEKFKNELEYDAKVWLTKRESDEAFKEPFDLMIVFALICARYVTAILISSRNLKSLCASGRASFTERFLLCSGLYVLSAVHQKLFNLLDDEWDHWPVIRGSHCFGVRELSTLSALDIFCTKVEISSFKWIFRWIWSVTGRPVECDPVSYTIVDARGDAGALNFIEWSHKFNFNIFMYSDLFPWSGYVRFPEIISDECDPETELDRVTLELEFEHHKAKAKKLLGLVSEVTKPAASGGEAGEKTNGQSITLKNFINTYCNLSRKPVVESKIELLLKYNRKKLITLPPLATTYRKGQSKFYYIDDLKSEWAKYQKIISTLPPLKS